MTRALRSGSCLRAWLLAAALAVPVSYAGLGHGAHAQLAAEHATTGEAIAVLCASALVVAARLTLAPPPAASGAPTVASRPAGPAKPAPARWPRADARASPAWLQRFLS